jgi:hypothetical protein
LPLDNRLAGYVCYSEDTYKERSKEFPTYYICKKLFDELNIPPVIMRKQLEDIFTKVPGTQNPKEITEEQYGELKKICRVRV